MKSVTQTGNRFLANPGPGEARLAGRNSNLLPFCRPDSGLRLEFRNASLESVLNYLRASAGLLIHVCSKVGVERPVDLWRDEPVSTADALALLRESLIQTGCMLIQKGPLFSIIRSQDVKKNCIPLPEL